LVTVAQAAAESRADDLKSFGLRPAEPRRCAALVPRRRSQKVLVAEANERCGHFVRQDGEAEGARRPVAREGRVDAPQKDVQGDIRYLQVCDALNVNFLNRAVGQPIRYSSHLS